MRYAVLADIHGNAQALDAVLQRLAAQRIDRYLCLGDVIGYGAQPLACLERLQALQAVMVAGNHEQGCIGRLPLSWFNDLARAALEWTRGELGITELDVLRRLPLTATEGPCTLVHASLQHPEQFTYVVDVAHIVESLSACRTLFCLSGHTHQPCVVEYERAARHIGRVLTAAHEMAGVPFVDDAAAMRYWLNPGSVGQPRDGDARASAAIIDTDARMIHLQRVPYDVAAAQAAIRQAGLPEFLAARLAVGR
ncbi:MAG: metallophosphoesterase family protein [Candidatus Omnitrophica bacterium]|nr:metallophosphoesterase family protein [Candidatus Omnitrophota bacterium]